MTHAVCYDNVWMCHAGVYVPLVGCNRRQIVLHNVRAHVDRMCVTNKGQDVCDE